MLDANYASAINASAITAIVHLSTQKVTASAQSLSLTTVVDMCYGWLGCTTPNATVDTPPATDQLRNRGFAMRQHDSFVRV